MFNDFCHTAEDIGATSKRLEKAALLRAYFAALSDDELVLAARYFSGRLFPLRDGRVVNVGGALLFNAIWSVAGGDENLLRERMVTLGDPGDAAREAFEKIETPAPELVLPDLAAFFDLLTRTPGSKSKGELLTAMLQRCTPLEAKYLVKLLSGDLRIGLKEGAVEDALARSSGVAVGEIQRVNMLSGDIGEVALRARHKTLEGATFRLFHAITFMLATPAADLEDVTRQMPAQFVVEDKYDGIRAQVHVAPQIEGDETLHGMAVGNRHVAIFSRTLDEITRSYPDVYASLAALLPPECDGIVLDGELVPFRDGRILPFQELQLRLGRKTMERNSCRVCRSRSSLMTRCMLGAFCSTSRSKPGVKCWNRFLSMACGHNWACRSDLVTFRVLMKSSTRRAGAATKA
jgi:DNA ligase-1